MRLWFSRRLDNVALVGPGAPPGRFDWLIAALLTIFVVAEAFVDQTWLVARVLSAFFAIGLVPFRRQIPLHAAVAAFAVEFAIALVALQQDEIFETTFGHAIAGLMLIYALCRWAQPADVLVGFGLTMAMVAITEFIDGDTALENVLFVVPWFGLALFALAMRYRARLTAERFNSVRLAERNALARDLHDTVAHHVSAIAVQAQAARFIAASNPEAVLQNIVNIEEIANTTIDEMRRMVGILRSDDDLERTVAATSLAEVNESGVAPAATFLDETSLEHLPTSVASALFRIAQEAVTNAHRHSRKVTFVDVEMTTRSTDVTIEITNDGTPTTRNSSGGYGLIGMQERVESLGGTISTGARSSSGWQVRAVIPLGRPS